MPRVNIDNIKTQIKSILDSANTTTGSPIDLSNNLDTRVQQVLKINPSKVYVDPGSFPFVSVYAENKDIEQQTMGHKGNQTSALRRADLTLNVVCTVQEPLIESVKADETDENCETLMENIEEILRANVDLNSTVSWAIPDNVSYHDAPWDERNVIRGAIMSLQCTVYY
jgi:hypothetical protein